MNKEILKPTIDVNGHTIKNEFYRDWMNEDSDISKAIYHLHKAADYLSVWFDIEENTYHGSDFSKTIEVFSNQVSHIRTELTNYVDNNIEILVLEKPKL